MIYVLTTFLSAFLLFMIQPLMGKMILPWFGGAPAVWTTCMLFFQVTLLGGYAYAHLIATRFKPKTQAWLHVGLLAIALVLMVVLSVRWGSPVLPGEDWKPVGIEAPVPHILGILLASVGLPYLLLSATSPLLQRWYSLRGHGEKTYRLYAVSNAGSLLGLLGYPLLAERFLTLPVQGALWAIAFAVFAVGCLLTVCGVSRSAAEEESTLPDVPPASGRPVFLTVITWLLLTMSTSAMLLAVTNALCQEVAAVPFLWVLPLTLYLATFIIAFDRPNWYRRRVFVPVTAALTVAVLVTNFLGIRLLIPVHVISFSAFLFFFCLTCHGELARLKPVTRHLTLFYLTIALGGAFGGVFVGLLAPLLFTGYWEFNIMATVAWVILAIVFARDKRSFFHRGDRWHFYLLFGFLIYLAVRFSLLFTPAGSAAPDWLLPPHSSGAIALVSVVLLAWLLRHRRLPDSKIWPRVLVGSVIFLAECFMIVRIRSTALQTVAADRNFFGTLRVQVVPADPDLHPPILRLNHGQIDHGFQYQHEELRRLPVGYHGPDSGVDFAIRSHPRRLAEPPLSLRVGVIGLGTGTMAAFARPGDLTRFYEINPTVVAYAAGERPWFTYLRDSKGSAEVVLGDARLVLERELLQGEGKQFDVLVMDAFSSDSIPVHLLTREAFDVYIRHLRGRESVIAVNISNRFLDLRDLMASLAEDVGFSLRLVELRKPSLLQTPSRWAIFSLNPRLFENTEGGVVLQSWVPDRQVVWTDAFSNLLHLLR